MRSKLQSNETDAGRRATRSAMVMLGLFSSLPLASIWLDHSPPVPMETAQLRIDPNRASREELQLLPGVGPVLADFIVAERHGSDQAYNSVEDLDRVSRVGPKTMQKLRPYLLLPPQQRKDQ